MPATPPPAVGPSAGRTPRSVRRPLRLRLIPALAALALPLLRAGAAHALPASPPGAPGVSVEPPPVPPQEEAPAPAGSDYGAYGAFRLGALAGVGFPRPISFEAFTRLGSSVGLGAEYGLLPSVTLDGVSVSAWAASLDLRLFPFHGAFFFAVRGGYQHLDGSATGRRTSPPGS
jgi:hypothetical protein